MTAGTGQNRIEMPRFRCHKEVHALKIKSIGDSTGPKMLTPEDPRYETFLMDQEWFEKHKPTAPGYFVLYSDGYKSWSPVKPFESGYELVCDDEDENDTSDRA